MRRGPMQLMAVAMATMATPVVHGIDVRVHCREAKEMVPPRLIGLPSENASPSELNRLARKNARARQTKRGKRGRR